MYLADIEKQLDYTLSQALNINNLYKQLQEEHKKVCAELDKAREEIKRLKENDKHDTNDLKS